MQPIAKQFLNKEIVLFYFSSSSFLIVSPNPVLIEMKIREL